MDSVRLNQNRYVVTIENRYIRFADRSKALFNVMLRDFGVKGVRVQEVVSLDEEMMALLQYGVPGLCLLNTILLAFCY